MSRWRSLLDTLKDGPARDLNLSTGTAFTLVVRVISYALVAITGIVMARALGAHDRGAYSLVTTIALTYAALSEVGISKAGVYFVGQRRTTVQDVTSNSLAWLLVFGTLWTGGALLFLVLWPGAFEEMKLSDVLVFALGGVLIQLTAMAKDQVVMTGSVLSYNLIEFAEPLLRAVLIMGGIALFGLSVTGVLSSWLIAIALTALIAVVLMSKRASLTPRPRFRLLKQQLSYGARGNLGFMLQAANHRLDVFLIAGMLGGTQLGYYAVAFGMAELLWQIPFALGALFFPKVSAMDAGANAEIAAVTCRRALVIIVFGVLALLATGHFLIGTLYGSEFLPGLTAFYILAPTGIFYTIHKVLSSALAGRGMPESTLIGGVASIPITIGLCVLLIPRLGIEGAAIASFAAYAVNAIVILIIFMRVTGRSLANVLLFNRSDFEFSLQTARTFLGRPQPVIAD
ncbi:MAG: polysaccharide biosynthesis C-terminal domain-containing protein [Dehalococcoidia bacterium]